MGDTLQVGGFTCRAVWPREPVAGLENADSLCLDVDYQGAKGTLSVLLTGDTERDQEELYAPDVGDIDVLPRRLSRARGRGIAMGIPQRRAWRHSRNATSPSSARRTRAISRFSPAVRGFG